MTKRLFDIFFAGIFLVMLSPLMLALGIVSWLTQGCPILFSQGRAALGGKEFFIKKYRSMRNTLGADGRLLSDEDRVTSWGRFLRRSRLDELPELFIILGGRMSLVGPRPLPFSTIDKHWMGRERLKVRPGLTGLAQVSGNTLLTDDEKFAIDAYYVSNVSLTLDISIILRTVVVVVRGERRDEALIRKSLKHAKRFNRGR